MWCQLERTVFLAVGSVVYRSALLYSSRSHLTKYSSLSYKNTGWNTSLLFLLGQSTAAFLCMEASTKSHSEELQHCYANTESSWFRGDKHIVQHVEAARTLASGSSNPTGCFCLEVTSWEGITSLLLHTTVLEGGPNVQRMRARTHSNATKSQGGTS